MSKNFEKNAVTWNCDDCSEKFHTQNEIEFHKLVQHKSKIVECTSGISTHLHFADAVESAMNNSKKCSGDNKLSCFATTKSQKKKSIMDKIKYALFTSESKKLDEESPPIENIRFQCYAPRNSKRNHRQFQQTSSSSSSSASSSSSYTPPTYAPKKIPR